MATSQADSVHSGITYDLVVDAGVASPDHLTRVIRTHFRMTSGVR
jgi:chloramphenicol 3-O-phosphotransferase